MKSLFAALVLLSIGLGCGGYGSGSGMGMTPAAAPQISPGSGTYSTPFRVTISDSTPGAVIYVTTDGSMPSLSSPIYQGTLTLTQPGQVQVQAIAAAGGYSTSSIAVANYTLQ
jgi:hypothetical protein